MYPDRRPTKPRSKTGERALGLKALEHPRSLAEMVEHRLRDAIVNAELAFGHALPEDETGLALGVSRTPLRAALGRLAALGLVTIVPNRGAFVFDPSLEDVKQLAGFRLMLETEAVMLCLDGAAVGTAAELRVALARMEQAHRDQDGTAYASSDTDFHAAFFRNCGNLFVANAFATISWQVAALRAHLSVERSWERDTSYLEHREIVEAFARQDRDKLRMILRDHILRAAKAYANVIAQGTGSV
ncbi:GntR family transcriptional regulator [Bosea sp. ASV33]|uniref:GntR family transcriptional regulator n=1 Tax=Bosea sp. ASV33 TaxID=2795106 RepID=UPI0018EADA6A|nr:GntR family transcriptional regulator [Bosea sp. ASV33]